MVPLCFTRAPWVIKTRLLIGDTLTLQRWTPRAPSRARLWHPEPCLLTAAERTACDPLWERHYCVSLASCDALSVSVPDLEDSRGLGFHRDQQLFLNWFWPDYWWWVEWKWTYVCVSRVSWEGLVWLKFKFKATCICAFQKNKPVCELFNNDQSIVIH